MCIDYELGFPPRFPLRHDECILQHRHETSQKIQGISDGGTIQTGKHVACSRRTLSSKALVLASRSHNKRAGGHAFKKTQFQACRGEAPSRPYFMLWHVLGQPFRGTNTSVRPYEFQGVDGHSGMTTQMGCCWTDTRSAPTNHVSRVSRSKGRAAATRLPYGGKCRSGRTFGVHRTNPEEPGKRLYLGGFLAHVVCGRHLFRQNFHRIFGNRTHDKPVFQYFLGKGLNIMGCHSTNQFGIPQRIIIA